MKKLTLIIFSILTIPVFGQYNYTYYSKTEVEQDLNFAFEKLINIHPVFLDNNKLIACQQRILEAEKAIRDSMTQNEIYQLLAPVFSSVNDGHTGVLVPTDQRVEFTKSGGKSFPFFVNIIDDSLYVSFYCGNDTSLFQGGEQITEINGISATEMVHKMEPLFSGEIAAIKQKEIASNFRFLIWMLYGFETDYDLVVKNNKGERIKIFVPGVTSAEFMQNTKRMPGKNQVNYILDLYPEKDMAVMKIRTFADLDGFCSFADSAFQEIKQSKIQNLVIDIRNNGGGRSIVVDSLMNYLTGKTYSQYKKTEVRISAELKEYYNEKYPDRSDWINSYAIGDLAVPDQNYSVPLAKENRFEGNIYLLTNRSTFSAAATFAGVFRDLKLGTVIGEETGGTISYFGDFWMQQTPNSKIRFYVSPKRFIQYGGSEYNRGVIPDYPVTDRNDSIMDFVEKMIAEQRQKN